MMNEALTNANTVKSLGNKVETQEDCYETNTKVTFLTEIIRNS